MKHELREGDIVTVADEVLKDHEGERGVITLVPTPEHGSFTYRVEVVKKDDAE